MTRAIIEPDGRIRIPDDVLRDWPSYHVAELVPTEGGILPRPARRLTWDEVFAGEPLRSRVTEPRDLPDQVAGDNLYL